MHVQPYSAHRMGKMYTQHRRCSVIMERHTVLKLDRDRFICQFHKKPATISGVFERIQHTLRASFLSALNRERCHGIPEDYGSATSRRWAKAAIVIGRKIHKTEEKKHKEGEDRLC
ncbi:uncharacterized protein T551_00689 [Pneumocystis jirovecii RU7]|uniref:Uncharacterized protein n=1 Tax=Pneumocystis jirovecii (strain RU7) TaxID=1408657 RepID=A0A0W4ZUF7_PNEJ7|nr:uncharacterized protein T551_00689 [Pneumocystis jirovecii RU7]KTW32007.1 hypothetical protein T551_00689 [Pneumocystis jirovecii RU7]